MLPGPIFRRAVKCAARPRDLFIMRILLALSLAIPAGGTMLVATLDDDIFGGELTRDLALFIFAIAVGIELGFVSVWAAGVISPSIAEEREKDTLPSLLLTRLTRFELVAAKLAGGLMPPLLLFFTGVPLFCICACFAGLSVLLLLLILAVATTTVTVAVSLAILASARRDRAGTARGEAIAWTFIWLVGVPIFTRVPARSGTIWGDLLVLLSRVASWFAPSSPLSLVTDNSWFWNPSATPLWARLIWMFILQVLLIVLAICGSVASLRVREPHPNIWDAHQGFRPPVSDDPIFWREYVLPWRGSRLPLVLILGRHVLILVRAIVMMLFQLVLLLITAAVPISLAVAVIWFGYLAFRELLSQRSFWIGPYDARDQFNIVIRSATAVLGLFQLLVIPASVSGRFTGERDKKTWEPLLTTTLSGADIITAKAHATGRGMWQAARWLIPILLVGIGCGAVHPLGALVAGVELPLAAWSGLALGTWLGIRPGSTTQAANSASALWSIGLMVFGGLVIVAPLCSVREFGVFWGWPAGVRLLIALFLMAVPPVTWAFARSLTRRCYTHFDEWVGRPHQ
jgi:ABC-type Na+ efflux pump permease subunit